MGKKVSNFKTSSTSFKAPYRLNKELHRIACDDGSTYVFVREQGDRRWRSLARYDRDGSRTPEPSRLPACIEAHMDGVTASGPHGPNRRDGIDQYWVK